MSIYSLVASEHAPNLNDNSNKDLYKNKLVSSATTKASEVVMPSYGDLFGKITDTKIGKATDESNYDLAQSEKEQLILYTCYPFELIGYKADRLFVYADKISGPTILEGQ